MYTKKKKIAINNTVVQNKEIVKKEEVEKYKPKVYFHFDIEGVLRGHQFSNVFDMNHYYIDAIKNLKDAYDVNIDICSIADLNSYDKNGNITVDRFKKLHEIIGDEGNKKNILQSVNNRADELHSEKYTYGIFNNNQKIEEKALIWYKNKLSTFTENKRMQYFSQGKYNKAEMSLIMMEYRKEVLNEDIAGSTLYFVDNDLDHINKFEDSGIKKRFRELGVTVKTIGVTNYIDKMGWTQVTGVVPVDNGNNDGMLQGFSALFYDNIKPAEYVQKGHQILGNQFKNFKIDQNGDVVTMPRENKSNKDASGEGTAYYIDDSYNTNFNNLNNDQNKIIINDQKDFSLHIRNVIKHDVDEAKKKCYSGSKNHNNDNNPLYWHLNERPQFSKITIETVYTKHARMFELKDESGKQNKTLSPFKKNISHPPPIQQQSYSDCSENCAKKINKLPLAKIIEEHTEIITDGLLEAAKEVWGGTTLLQNIKEVWKIAYQNGGLKGDRPNGWSENYWDKAKNFSAKFQKLMAKNHIMTGNLNATHFVGMRLMRVSPSHIKALEKKMEVNLNDIHNEATNYKAKLKQNQNDSDVKPFHEEFNISLKKKKSQVNLKNLSQVNQSQGSISQVSHDVQIKQEPQTKEEFITNFMIKHNENFQNALNEIQNGKKAGCWMWYIFPQIKGTGNAKNYKDIPDFKTAIELLNDATFTKNYLTILTEVNKKCKEKGSGYSMKYLKQLFGNDDALKFVSSITLFDEALASINITKNGYFATENNLRLQGIKKSTEEFFKKGKSDIVKCPHTEKKIADEIKQQNQLYSK